MDERLIDGFGAARAPARGRFRIYALLDHGEDVAPEIVIGILDATRDRSLQVRLRSSRRQFLGRLRRPQILKRAIAYEGDLSWWVVGRGSAREESAEDGPDILDVTWPLRAAGPDIATALVVLRAESEHTVTMPGHDGPVGLQTEVDERGVLRVDVRSWPLHTPIFIAPADATDHDLIPDEWPPLIQAPPAGGPEYAPFLPPLWRAAADLLREAARPH